MSKLFVAIAIMLMPTLVLAHSGHGHIEAVSIWHWLLEFDHIGWIVPVAIVLFVAVKRGWLNKSV
ncbi:hypothetical protein Ga0123462_1507 [Mariprofundus ferrinatatus]|uniref:HupE / UreJ protein n=1 Tax=Mariprofundus ferrinatatus TaxID=1921087 RepID=A0A2K8L4X4_9PROT|nr:hypothetical protein [Mariprofundus ferrinatatus]ATX82370.1 hypothetical protein Ga0123462_1507 [Mariprofundus ferrinatatus]